MPQSGEPIYFTQHVTQPDASLNQKSTIIQTAEAADFSLKIRRGLKKKPVGEMTVACWWERIDKAYHQGTQR